MQDILNLSISYLENKESLFSNIKELNKLHTFYKKINQRCLDRIHAINCIEEYGCREDVLCLIGMESFSSKDEVLDKLKEDLHVGNEILSKIIRNIQKKIENVFTSFSELGKDGTEQIQLFLKKLNDIEINYEEYNKIITDIYKFPNWSKMMHLNMETFKYLNNYLSDGYKSVNINGISYPVFIKTLSKNILNSLGLNLTNANIEYPLKILKLKLLRLDAYTIQNLPLFDKMYGFSENEKLSNTWKLEDMKKEGSFFISQLKNHLNTTSFSISKKLRNLLKISTIFYDSVRLFLENVNEDKELGKELVICANVLYYSIEGLVIYQEQHNEAIIKLLSCWLKVAKFMYKCRK